MYMCVLWFHFGNKYTIQNVQLFGLTVKYVLFRKYKLDVKESRRSVKKLRLEADNVKHSLSTLGNAQCAVESLFEGVDFHCQVSR